MNLRTLSFCLLAVFLASSRAGASEADAVAISRNIQARHLIYGTILDPVFASPTSDTVVSYSRCGDSAIWTGHYLAAEAFRYKVTHSPEAAANAVRAIAGIKSLLDVTGNNVLARCLVPNNSPYGAAIASEEGHNGVFRSGPDHFWIGNTSRDQYSGVMFGLGVAYDMLDDPDAKASISAMVTRMVQFLRDKNWLVIMPNGSFSTTFLIRPDQQLAYLQLARHVNPDRFSTAYDIARVLQSPGVLGPVTFDVLSDNSYSKFNLDSIDMYTLIHLESSSFGMIYRKAYDILRNHTDDHHNAFFNMIDRALNGVNTARDADTRAMLDQWLLRPRRDFAVDLRTKYKACGNPEIACEPIPVVDRVNTDFVWQRSPFQLVAGGQGDIETAGIDYILPYWMARFYGIVDADNSSGLRVVSSASGGASAAPESLATLKGSDLAPAIQITPTQPPPFTLGGVSLLVKDSAGQSRPAALYYASPDQINFVVPAGTANGAGTLIIQRPGAADRTASIDVRAIAPGLFTADGTGKGVAAAVALRITGNTSTYLPFYSCAGTACTTTPIDLVGDVYIALFGTGMRNRTSIVNVVCVIGGASVPIQYAGAQGVYAGLDQVNIQLPSSLRGIGEADLVVTVDGQPSNPVRINIR